MAKPPPIPGAHVPLEILANLVYLTKYESGDAEKVMAYMLTAEEQVSKLASVLGLSLEIH